MNLSDKEFLDLQCSQLDTAHIDDIIAIKNCSNKLLAISPQYSTEFALNKDKISGQDITITGINPFNANVILEYENILRQTNKLQELIYIHKGATETINYYVRKRLIINPYTNNVVGIHVRMEYFTPSHLRKTFLQITKPHLINSANSKINLTDIQNEIAFCIILGYTARKEITSFLCTHLPINFYSEHVIKNALLALYAIFNCNTTAGILNAILTRNIKVTIPQSMLEYGVFLIRR